MIGIHAWFQPYSFQSPDISSIALATIVLVIQRVSDHKRKPYKSQKIHDSVRSTTIKRLEKNYRVKASL